MNSTRVIVLNCGSSSIKLAVVAVETGETDLTLLVESLNSDRARLIWKNRAGESTSLSLPYANHAQALEVLLDRVCLNPVEEVRFSAVGHRVVHGGELFKNSTLIDDSVIQAIESCIPLAPLHNPANLEGIQIFKKHLPHTPQVAVFDTAFHQSMPLTACLYAVPYELYQNYGVRKYGFHGTSYRYVAQESARLLERPLKDLNLVICHLGNGSSACAVSGGMSVDTTMGLTPLEGLVMGTRSGDVDPNLHEYLSRKCGSNLSEITRLLNCESGLLGISGRSHDMRQIAEAAHAGEDRARLALDVYCHRLAAKVMSMCAALKSLDALVFTGGIGENSVVVREKTVHRLSVLGLKLNPYANADSGRATQGRISKPPSRPILVVPTNEELMIARDTAELITNLL